MPHVERESWRWHRVPPGILVSPCERCCLIYSLRSRNMLHTLITQKPITTPAQNLQITHSVTAAAIVWNNMVSLNTIGL